MQLRKLLAEVDKSADPHLDILTHYFLASFLALRGEVGEARELTEEGILRAWEASAKEELELLDQLSRELPE